MKRKRFRELGFKIGKLKTGDCNAITDVKGVVVGHKTIIKEDVASGLTVIMPNDGQLAGSHYPAGFYSFNGTGEFTGSHWLEETGTLVTPIIFTGSHLLGLTHHYLSLATRRIDKLEPFSMGVVGETWDGWLSDLEKTTLSYQDLEDAILSAGSGQIAEGNVGGGTGMICYEFKGGIGTSSRVVEFKDKDYTIGAIVQTNFGRREDLIINNLEVGKLINQNDTPLPWNTHANDGSLLVTIAADAPLTAQQCKRIAKRASIAMARTGAIGEGGSGDFFLSFSTSNQYNYDAEKPYSIKMFPSEEMDLLFEGAIEAVEEAIINSLCMAQTIEGQKGRKAYQLPLNKLSEILKD